MLRPIIVVGCGGSGGKTVQLLHRSIEIRLRRAGWNGGIPAAWRLLYIDTPKNQEQFTAGVPKIPEDDYLALVNESDSYRDAQTSFMSFLSLIDEVGAAVGWRPDPFLPVALSDGAGTMRPVGRIAAFAQLARVSEKLSFANSGVKDAAAASQLAELATKLGTTAAAAGTAPYIIVVSSLAGGTGSGIFLDVCDLIRVAEPSLHERIMGVLFTSEVFSTTRPAVRGLEPNSLAAISELMCGYYDRKRPPNPMFQRQVRDRSVLSKAGVDYPYIVGMTTLSGSLLSDVFSCYQAVAETLVSVVVDSEVSDQIAAYATANWLSEQDSHSTSWVFGQQREIGGDPIPGGVVSSFGSARVSVGMSWFTEYTVRRLVRDVVDFQSTGFETFAKGIMAPDAAAAASQDDVIAHMVQREGVAFVARCKLQELNLDEQHPHDEVIDAIMTKAQLDRAWEGWHARLATETQGATTHSQQWMKTIADRVNSYTPDFEATVASLIDQGAATFVKEAPERVLAEVSRAVFEFGLPVSLGLVQYLRDEQVRVAAVQLRSEAQIARQSSVGWTTALGAAFAGAKDKLRADSKPVREGIRAASLGAYQVASAAVRERAAQLLDDFAVQVLDPIERTLVQVSAALATEADENKIDGWPGSQGVPTAYLPPPFEFTLVDPATWPKVYEEKMLATTGEVEWASAVRTAVGSGEFEVPLSLGRPAKAMTITKSWNPGATGRQGWPVTLETAFSVEEITDRARLWLARETPFGRFLGQGLRSYLAGDDDPEIEQKLAKFSAALSSAMRAAEPLIGMEQDVASAVHPHREQSVVLIREKLPIPQLHKARERAEALLLPWAQQTASGAKLDSLFSESGPDVDGVTYVSRLRGAVHPVAVSSLVSPIAAGWAAARGDSQTISEFWSLRRRARVLNEFIPVAPPTLNSFIRGWFVGRFLGLIPEPSQATGFSIARVSQPAGATTKTQARFPWPLLSGKSIDATSRPSWVARLLESIPLGMALFPTDLSSLDAYDELYLLGQSDPTSPGPMFDALNPVLTKWLLHGEVDRQLAPMHPALLGDTFELRQKNFVAQLRETSDQYTKILTERPIHKTREWFDKHFNGLPPGYDLFPQIVTVIDDLSSKVEQGVVGPDTPTIF